MKKQKDPYLALGDRVSDYAEVYTTTPNGGIGTDFEGRVIYMAGAWYKRIDKRKTRKQQLEAMSKNDLVAHCMDLEEVL